jgi:16S rRNA (guanine527-N7)-methyltransferase
MNFAPEGSSFAEEFNALLVEAGLDPLNRETTAKFSLYLSLILRWNVRMNLTAVRDSAGIMSRHFMESIACARFLPPGIASLLDFGSGAGFPGIPIALCRPEIAVTLAESQTKKAAFLQEAVRVLDLNTSVFVGRAEELEKHFDCVILRAVDRMDRAVSLAAKLVRPKGTLAVLTTTGHLSRVGGMLGNSFRWWDPQPMPGSAQRILALGERV